MRRFVSPFVAAALATSMLGALPAAAATPAASVPIPQLVKQVSIPHTTYKLKNGLTVIIHDDADPRLAHCPHPTQ